MKYISIIKLLIIILLLNITGTFENKINGQISYSDPGWERPLKKNLEKMAEDLTNNLKPWKVPERSFKVEDYGAIADSMTINTKAIQKAIDICSASGGGVVIFSKGNYVTGTFELKSGVMLEVSEGARILGSTNLADYPERIENFKSVLSEIHKYRTSLIYAEKADRIGIRGKGEIYFRGERKNFPGPESISEITGRPFGIRMIECKNVVLNDIFLHNSAGWMQLYIFCENLIFDHIKVLNQGNFNNDGLDPDGCRNVIVKNCFINSEDDAMCLKGASNRVSENILIENSTFVTTCNALKFGTDTQGPFRNILVRNVILGGVPDSLPSIKGRQSSTGITVCTVDGGNVENVFFSHVTINQARCPIFLRVGSRLRVLESIQKPSPGYLKNIIIEDIKGENNYRQGSFISGIKGYPVQNIIIRNMNLKMEGGGEAALITSPVKENESGYPDAHQFPVIGLPSFGFYIRHAENIYLSNIRVIPVKPDARNCFSSGDDIRNVTIDGKGL